MAIVRILECTMPDGNVSLRDNFLKVRRPYRNTNTIKKPYLLLVLLLESNPRDIKENR